MMPPGDSEMIADTFDQFFLNALFDASVTLLPVAAQIPTPLPLSRK